MRPRSGACAGRAVPSNCASSSAPVSPQLSSTTTPRPSARCAPGRRPGSTSACGGRVSSASSTDSGSCTRTGDRFVGGPAAAHQRQVHAAAGLVAEGVGGERAARGLDLARADLVDQRLGAAAVLDQVGDGADLQAVFGGEKLQVGQARHRAVVVHDLADHRRGRAAGHRARSQPASVWPARISTPPSSACSGKMWPGCTRSAAHGVAAPPPPARCARGRRPRCRWSRLRRLRWRR